jgi:hypothetical protein
MRPSNLLTGSPTPPPFPVGINTGVCIHILCNGGGIGGLRQINTCRQVPLLVNLKKSGQLGFGVFIDIWSMFLGILIMSAIELNPNRQSEYVLLQGRQ